MKAIKNSDKAAKSGSGLVTVAYNSPRGIVFRLGEKVITINGNNTSLMGREKGIIPVGKYGYTRIPAEDWAAIEKVYGSMAIFKNGLIFAETSADRAADRSEEQAETRHGLEPVNPETTQTEEAKAEV
jgi:hypothetical protein